MNKEIKKNSPKKADAKGRKETAPEAKARGDKGETKKTFEPKRIKRIRRKEAVQDEFEQRIIDIARVTRVMAGGKRMRFRACVALGNKNGKVGIGVAKGADVTIAASKAAAKARKNIIKVPLINDTIPHEIYHKFGAAKILLKPSKQGKGVIAGGAVRVILDLAGIKNITSKILGTNNKINNVKCVIEALKILKAPKKSLAAGKAAKEKEPAPAEQV